MLPIPVFVGVLEFVEGIVLRIEQLPVAPHECLVEHWVFHGHPRSRTRPTAGPGSGFGEGTGWRRGPEGGGADLSRTRHARRTGTPRAARYSLASPTVCWPKWKIEAARTALAPPSAMPSYRCSRVPTPPLAMTGTGTASPTARRSSQS